MIEAASENGNGVAEQRFSHVPFAPDSCRRDIISRPTIKGPKSCIGRESVFVLSTASKMKAKSLNTVVFSTIAIFALGTVESGLANTSYEDGAWIKRGILDKRKKSPQHSGADARRLLQRNVQVFSLVPSDISAGEASFRCNEGGIRTDLMSGYCIDYHSASERTSWRLRYEQSGRIDRVFKFRGYKNRYASFDLWAVFDNSLYGERGSVSFTSPEAEKVHEEQNPHAVRGGKKEQDNNEQDNNETTSQGSQTF